MTQPPNPDAPVYLFQPQIYRINDLLGWSDRSELVLSPNFQRRRVWTRQGKSYLIDSIIRGMPIPQFFVRELVHTKERRTVREVVDGQQRISTILDFIDGKFTILPSHSKELARTPYASLPESIQQAILFYPLSVNIINTTNDAVLLDVFSRINAYSIPLNRPEKLNAKYTGAFKNTIHEIARRHLAFWTRARMLTPQSIARMGDVDFVSDLVVTMVDGLQNQKNKVEAFYKRYDDEFPFADQVSQNFAATLELTERCLGVAIEETEFRRPALFYSLFAAVYDVAFGFGYPATRQPNGFNENAAPAIRDGLQALSDAIAAEETPAKYVAFVAATLRSTDKIAQRTSRDAVIRPLVAAAFTSA